MPKKPNLLNRPMRSHQPRYIYALIDPRDNTTRYIGMSVDIQKRFYQHLRGQCGRHTWYWVRELQQLGTSPVLQILEVVYRDDDMTLTEFKLFVLEREAYWIREYLRMGAPLLNTFGVTMKYPRSS
jgi:hypothetical protein